MNIGPISKAAIVGFLVTAVTVVILPLVVVPTAQQSEYFCLKVLWVEVLSVLAWAYLGGGIQFVIRSSIQDNRSAAVIPALGIAIFLYIGLSLFFLLSSSLAPENACLSRYHLARQIFIAFLFAVTTIGLYSAAVIASKGAKTFSPEVRTPEQLAALLLAEETRLSIGATKETKLLIQSFKTLREKISYSLPSIQIIGSDPQYLDFAGQMTALIESVRTCSDESVLKESELRAKADNLLHQADLVAASLKNRKV